MEKLDIERIDSLYSYNVSDLGYSRKKDESIFKVWSPIADNMELCIYDRYDEKVGKPYSMQMNKGVWELTLNENLEGKFYTFIATIKGEKREGVDPYGKALSVNGEKAAIIDIKQSNPDNWDNHKIPKRSFGTDSIIYEGSVRDLSSNKNSGIKNKGKFLALTEENTKTIGGVSTGLSHIKEMGITHIQLLPIFDFSTIDESKDYNSEKYNWGYDPANYNAPEGSYSTNPFDPYSRIRELKEGIKTIHENGISVIMDVVYNHMYDVEKSGFHKLVPGYYFRYNGDGTLCNDSMCGNALASENEMCRNFIVDSIVYWAKEYKIDGFRFDLMGLLDVTTIKKIREELDKIDPSIILLGEGWNMHSHLKEEDRAVQGNAYKLKNVAFFNDSIRDGLRGNPFSHEAKGFLSGEWHKEIEVKKAIVGAISYNNLISTWGEVEPNQNVNYIECHDNHTLFDKLNLTIKDRSELKELSKLGSSIILLSQGIPFLHAGQEFLRTKNGVENSYNAPDSINSVDWSLKEKNLDVVDYTKGLIALRKKYNLFRMRSVEEIKKNLIFLTTPRNSVGYKLVKEGEEIIVIHNGNKQWIKVDFGHYGRFKTLVNKEFAGVETLAIIEDDKIFVEGQSTTVLVKM